MPCQPYLNVQLTAAYNVYLNILDHVDRQLKKALGHDTDNWRMLNSCPACFYKLEDEPILDFDWLVSIDGNNSLKRWDMSTYGVTPQVDTHRPHSDYWLSDPTWITLNMKFTPRYVLICHLNATEASINVSLTM